MIAIPKYEQGVTRVIALSLSTDAAKALRDDPEKVRDALGCDRVSAAGVEVFPVRDLGDLGLVGYLREGVDAQTADLNRDAAKLAALDGWVMLVHSIAFQGQAATLRLAPELTLVGSYAQQDAAPADGVLESEAAQPYTAPPAKPAEVKRRQPMGSVWIILAVMGALILVLIWALGGTS